MKILILRSCPLNQYIKVKEKIKSGNTISVLTVEGSERDICSDDIFEVFTYKKPKLRVSALSAKTLRALKKASFDKVIIIYANYLGEGYRHVKKTAVALHIPLIEEWNAEGYIYTYKRNDFKNMTCYFNLHFLYCCLIWGYLFIKNLFKKKRNESGN